ncbi:abortive infection protein [Lacticaseibacillus zeae DSM 20178 = KCTC 3804]|uniref:Abortive infection protein n=2 Tax=Lacticaseibacillus zeae TaxID=57037 RepID=A0A0R1ERG7_LACZE|nr:abortive infection protein [Lacticaseibacillus zeae DSM 20178 = KCTC 3804]
MGILILNSLAIQQGGSPMSDHKPKCFFWKAISVWLIAIGAMYLVDAFGEHIKLNFMLQNIYRGLVLFGILLLLNWLFIHQKVSWKPSLTIFKAVLLGIPTYLFVCYVTYIGSQQLHLDYNWPFAISVGLAAGPFEEYLCRGLLLGLLLKTFNRYSKVTQIWTAVLISSLLFGLLHAINLSYQSLNDTILQMISAGLGGVFYSAVYLRTGTILMAMIVHGLWDFILNLVRPTLFNIPVALTGAIVIADALGILISIFYLRKSKIHTIQLEKLT